MSKTFISSIIFFIFTPFVLLADNTPMIPDYVDFNKYHQAYLQKKSISDEKRSTTNHLKSIAQDIDSNIDGLEKSIQNNITTINNSAANIQYMEREIPRLQRANERHKQSTISNSAAIVRNNNKKADIEIEAIDIDSNISYAKEEYNYSVTKRDRIGQRLERVKNNITRLINEIDESEKEFAGYEQALNNTLAQIETLRVELIDLKTLYNNKSSRLAKVEKRAQNLSYKLSDIEDRIAQIKSEIQSLRRSKKSSQSELAAAQNLKKQIQGEQAAIKQKIKTIREQIAANQNQISSLEQQIQNHNQKVADLGNELTNLKTRKINIEGKISTKENLINEKTNLKTTLEGQLPAIENKIAKKQARIAQLEASDDPDKATKIAALKQQLTTLQENKTKKSEKISALATLISTETKALTKLRNQLVKVGNRIAAIPTLKSENESAVTAKTNKISQLNKIIQTDKTTLETHKASKGDIELRLSNTNQLIANIKSTIFSLQANIDQKIAVRDGIIADEKNPTINTLQQVNDRITKLRNRVANLSASINSHSREKSSLEQTLPGQEQNLDSINEEIEGQYQQLGLLKARKKLVEGRLSNAIADANFKREELDSLLAARADLTDRINFLITTNENLAEENSQLELSIIDNDNTINNYQFRIRELNELISTKEDRNEELRILLKTRRDDATKAWAAFQIADDDANIAEDITLAKWNDYLRIKSNYDREKLAAQTRGREQGDKNGWQDGTEPGSNTGEKAGYDEGFEVGKVEGKLFGYRKGLLDGLSKGEEEGYSHGTTTPANYEAGFAEGLKEGRKNAYTIAHQTSYFECRAEQKRDLLSMTPDREITINNQDHQGQGHPSVIDTPYQPPFSGATVADYSADEANEAAISLTKNNINNLQNQINDLPAETSFDMDSLQIKVSIDLNQADCQADYIDFVTACQESYQVGYKHNYELSFRKSYRLSKPEAYLVGKEDGFVKYQEERWQEGYDQSYPLTYQKFDAIGASESIHQGYTEGKAAGYQKFLAQAKREECKAGKLAENAYFQNNPVLRLQKVSISKVRKTTPDGSFIAGDDLYLNLQIANHGEQDSEFGHAYVRFEAVTGNATVDSSTIKIAPIPANSMGNILRVGLGKIKWTTVFAEQVTFKVTAYMPDGVTETIRSSISTKLHITTNLSFNTLNLKPKWGYRHTIRMVVSNNTAAHSQKGFHVTMHMPEIEGVRNYTPTASVSALASGASQELEFKYALRRKSLIGREIPITFTVYYENSVAATVTKTIVVQSKW